MRASLTAAAEPKPRRGRPPGTLAPLTRWLRRVIAEMRRDGFGQAEVWRQLCLAEDDGEDGKSFRVSEETADEFWRDVGADLAGERVTFESYRKTWLRAR